MSNTSQFDFPSPVSSIYSQNSRFVEQYFIKKNIYKFYFIFICIYIEDIFNQHNKGIWEIAIQETLSI